MNKFYLLIAGSRDFEDYKLLKQYTDYALRHRAEK
jgi:hypothetical protein